MKQQPVQLQEHVQHVIAGQGVITPHDCTRGKVIGSVVLVLVLVVLVVVNTNFGISQHQGTCAACKRHVGVATGGKLAPAPSNRFNTTIVLQHLPTK